MLGRGVLRFGERHEIDDFTHSVGGKEACDQHIGVGPIDLLFGIFLNGWSDSKITAFVFVENGAENTGRIEIRETKPVNGAVLADQRRCTQISDYAVVFDWLIGHVWSRAEERLPGYQAGSPEEETSLAVHAFLLTLSLLVFWLRCPLFRLALIGLTRLAGIALRLFIEFILAVLAAERIFLALIGTGGGSLVLVYLHSTNRIFSHDVLYFRMNLTPALRSGRKMTVSRSNGLKSYLAARFTIA
jgi:hypothetical protein